MPRTRKAGRRLFGNQLYVDKFNCGHPRTRENSTAKVRPQCKQCSKGRIRARSRAFKCGHAVTPENSIVCVGPERTVRRCKTCRDRNGRVTHEPHLVKTIRVVSLDELRHFAPRPLPIVDTCGRSYSLFPLKRRTA